MKHLKDIIIEKLMINKNTKVKVNKLIDVIPEHELYIWQHIKNEDCLVNKDDYKKFPIIIKGNNYKFSGDGQIICQFRKNNMPYSVSFDEDINYDNDSVIAIKWSNPYFYAIASDPKYFEPLNDKKIWKDIVEQFAINRQPESVEIENNKKLKSYIDENIKFV